VCYVCMCVYVCLKLSSWLLEEISLMDPITIVGGNIEVVSSFHYLRYVMECHGGVKEELTVRVSRAPAVFGALHASFFNDGSLSVLRLLCTRL